MQRKVLGDEGRGCVVTAIDGAIRERDGVEEARVPRIGEDACAGRESLRGFPRAAEVVGDGGSFMVGGPDPGAAIGGDRDGSGATRVGVG